jgi:hypothetical protein
MNNMEVSFDCLAQRSIFRSASSVVVFGAVFDIVTGSQWSEVDWRYSRRCTIVTPSAVRVGRTSCSWSVVAGERERQEKKAGDQLNSLSQDDAAHVTNRNSSNTATSKRNCTAAAPIARSRSRSRPPVTVIWILSSNKSGGSLWPGHLQWRMLRLFHVKPRVIQLDVNGYSSPRLGIVLLLALDTLSSMSRLLSHHTHCSVLVSSSCVSHSVLARTFWQ